MSSIDWTLDFELNGEERQEQLAEAEAIIKSWGLVMPPCEPLAIHFGLNDFRTVGEVEFWIVNDTSNQYCGKFLFLFERQRCPLHYHRMKDETFYVMRGTVSMQVEGEDFVLETGAVYKMAPGKNHTFSAIGGPALILEVSLPSIEGDNFFADKRIGRSGVI